MEPDRRSLTDDLRRLGLEPGGLVMVHSSFSSLGVQDPEDVIGALLAVLGPQGTLMLPALTYLQEPRDVHDARATPTCVGFLTEYFRKRPGTLRSLHPTHSVCAVGGRAAELLGRHFHDTTPCGPNSPFSRNIDEGGSILMLGCGLRPNTTMHAVEERAGPPYLFGDVVRYTVTDLQGRSVRKDYRHHGFRGWWQRYDRVASILGPPALRAGTVGHADSYLIDAAAMCRVAVERMRDDPYAFVERAR